MVVGTDRDYGNVYIYSLQDGIWSEVLEIPLPDGNIFFGGSLDLSGETLIVSSQNYAHVYK